MLRYAQISLKLYFKDLRYRDAFLLIIIIVIIITIIIVVIVFYLTLIKIHINDKTN